MKKRFKNLILSLVLVSVLVPTSKAFFLGNDVYTAEEYKEANIVWKHNTIFIDEYYFNGTSITQELAEQLTSLYRSTFKKGLQDVMKDEYFNLYNASAQFTINTIKGLNKEIRRWEKKYYELWSENIQLKNLLNK